MFYCLKAHRHQHRNKSEPGLIVMATRLDCPDRLQVTDGTQNVVNVTGLSPGVEYEIFVVDQSGSGTGEDEITQITTSTVSADPPPPSFDVGYPKVANVTDKSLDLLVKSQGDGHISYVLLPKGAPAPTPEQIRAGLDSNGNPIGLSGSVAVTDGTQNVVNVTGLSPGVEYEIFVVDQSGSGTGEDEITQITTSTVPADPPPPSFDVGYPKVANVTDKSLDLLVKSQGDGNIFMFYCLKAHRHRHRNKSEPGLIAMATRLGYPVTLRSPVTHRR